MHMYTFAPICPNLHINAFLYLQNNELSSWLFISPVNSVAKMNKCSTWLHWTVLMQSITSEDLDGWITKVYFAVVICCVLARFISLRLQSLKLLLKRFRIILDAWHLFWFEVVSRVVLVTIDIWSAITLSWFSYAGLHDTVLFSSLHDSAITSPAGHVTNKVRELCWMIVFNLFCHWDGLKFH